MQVTQTQKTNKVTSRDTGCDGHTVDDNPHRYTGYSEYA